MKNLLVTYRFTETVVVFGSLSYQRHYLKRLM